MRRLTRFLTLIVAVGAVSLVACEDDEPTGPAPSVEQVTVSPESVELKVGGSIQFTAQVQTTGGAAQTVEWSSSDPSIVSVSDAGVATAEAPGTASVIATSTENSNKRDAAAVTVTATEAEIEQVSVTPEEVTVKKGNTTTLKANIDATETVEGLSLSFSSADTDIVEVTGTSDDDGDGINEVATLEAKNTGTVAVTATASASNAQSKSASASVEVVEEIQDKATVSVNTPGGSTLSGTFTAQVTVDPGTESVTAVRVLVDGQVVGEQTFSSVSKSKLVKAAAPSTIDFDVDSDSFDPLTGEVDFKNGSHEIKAEIDTEQRGTDAATATRTVSLDNTDGWIVFMETQVPSSRNPNLLAHGSPGDRNVFADGPGGFRWTTGSVSVAGVPVIYNQGRSIQNATFLLSGSAAASSDDFTAPTTLSSQTDMESLIERLTGESVDGPVMGFQTTFSPGAMSANTAGGYRTADPDNPDIPVVRSVDNTGNTGPSDLLAVRPAFAPSDAPGFIFSDGVGTTAGNIGINIDNAAPIGASFALAAPSQNDWIHDGYPLSAGYSGGTEPGGVGIGGVNSRFFGAQAGGTCPTGFGEVSTGADFTPTQQNNVYTACAQDWDAFANMAVTPLGEDFGSDHEDPSILLDGTSLVDQAIDNADGTNSGYEMPATRPGFAGTDVIETIDTNVSDPGPNSSGFNSGDEIRRTVKHVTPSGISCFVGAAGCTKGVVAGAAAAGATDNDAGGQTLTLPNDGAPMGFGEGYYVWDAFSRDRAGNRSPNGNNTDTQTIRTLFDETAPFVGGFTFPTSMDGGEPQTVTANAEDNITLLQTQWNVGYPTSGTNFTPIYDRIDLIGSNFPGSDAQEIASNIVSQTTVDFEIPFFLRGAERMDGADAPTNSPAEASDFNVEQFDAAWNSGAFLVSFDPQVVENPVGFTTSDGSTATNKDFGSFAITSPSSGTTVSTSGNQTISFTATLTHQAGQDSPFQHGVRFYFLDISVPFSFDAHRAIMCQETGTEMAQEVVTGSGTREFQCTWDPSDQVPANDPTAIIAVGMSSDGDAAVTQDLDIDVNNP